VGRSVSLASLQARLKGSKGFGGRSGERESREFENFGVGARGSVTLGGIVTVLFNQTEFAEKAIPPGQVARPRMD
jgi:hypothetical protein